MHGCPGYLLYRLVERLSGKAALAPFIRTTSAKLLGLPRLRQATEGNFRRILAYVNGKEPSPAETASLRGKMALLLARDLLSKYEALRDPARFEVPADLRLLPTLQGLLRAGRGAVLVTPHFGDTTMLFFGLARAGLTLHVLVNRVPASAPGVLAASGVGLHLTDLSTGAKHYLDALARNELVLLMTDMDFYPGGRTLDFFGAPFNPPHGPARLALAAGAPVLPVYAVWDGSRHSLLCDAPISTEGAEQEVVEKAILRSMEKFIGRNPEHWLIYHDPWDLEACARENRRQLRQLRMRGMLEGLWHRLTKSLTRARI
jgi:lauroyl/myristoyl acyltransferase